MTYAGCVGRAALRSLLLLSAALGRAGRRGTGGCGRAGRLQLVSRPPVVKRQAVFSAVTDPSITAYGWDLDGNGSYGDATGPQARRTFQRVRTYEIGLATLDDQGGISQQRKSVNVVADGDPNANQLPEASFVFFPAGPVAGELITFVSTSTDPDSPVPASALSWDLNGDGVFDDAVGPSATTSYPVAGTYTISLQIATNTTDVATLVLNVGAPGVPGTVSGNKGSL